MIDCLADMLEAEGFITRNTSQAIKADSTSSPYAKASQMIGPAIECANRNPEKNDILITILTSRHFGLSL